MILYYNTLHYNMYYSISVILDLKKSNSLTLESLIYDSKQSE